MANLAGFATNLLANPELRSRARCIAEAVAEIIPGSAVNVYRRVDEEGQDVWTPQASRGDVSVRGETIPIDDGTLGTVSRDTSAVTFSTSELAREDYAHLDVRKTFRSLAYVPLISDDKLAGAIEILSFESTITVRQLESLKPLAEVAAAALSAGHKYENERNTILTSLSRFAQLYDLEKTFSSAREMNELLELIGTKFCELIECASVNVWLLQGDETVELMYQTGHDPTVKRGNVQGPGEGLAGTVSDTGEGLLITDPEDERLIERNAGVDEGVESILVVPIMDKEFLVGVVEAVNKTEGKFNSNDLFALTTLTETASVALHNASMLQAERKVEVLETLVTVSNEITSTLNLDRMLQTIVNAPQAVIPYERAAVALDQGGRVKIRAVTSSTVVNTDAPEIAPLNEVLQWAALAGEVLHVTQHDNTVDADRSETRAKFEKYFRDSGMRGFYAVPLNDDSGRVGILALESSDPDFLSTTHKEILRVLAGQATVALRNAQMYKEVPFISVLEPILHQKRRFMAMSTGRRAAAVALALAVVAFLILCPLPLRVDGDAIVAPVHRAKVQPEVEGVISKVLIREGERVEKGQVIAEMNAWQYRASLAEAEAGHRTAQLQMNRALAANNGTEAGMQRVQADYWSNEVERARGLLEKTQLRSPISGTVATPHVENLVGRKLELGDSLAEVVDVSEVIVDVAVDDVDAGLIKKGQSTVLKMNSNALRTLSGNVVVVSPHGVTQDGSSVFYARVAVRNDDQSLRAGMEGRGKVSIGWYPSGYVFFRRPAIWIYSQVWSWIGW